MERRIKFAFGGVESEIWTNCEGSLFAYCCCFRNYIDSMDGFSPIIRVGGFAVVPHNISSDRPRKVSGRRRWDVSGLPYSSRSKGRVHEGAMAEGGGTPNQASDADACLAARSSNIVALPGWTDEQAVRFFMTGLAYNDLPARQPMPPYRFKREDAEAIVAYLQSLTSENGK